MCVYVCVCVCVCVSEGLKRRQGYVCRHDSVSLESTAKQNCDMWKGANYGVTQLQCAAISTADRTHF